MFLHGVWLPLRHCARRLPFASFAWSTPLAAKLPHETLYACLPVCHWWRSLPDAGLTLGEQKKNIHHRESTRNNVMHPRSQPSEKGADELEVAVNEAIAACGGDMRSTIRLLIVANEYLESEACELMAAVSHAYMRGRFRTYSG
jgi:hypothetical protein